MKIKTKYIIFLQCILCCLSPSYSDNNFSRDSLTQLLKTKKLTPFDKVDLFINMAKTHVDEDYQLAIETANIALELAKKVKYKQGVYESNFLLGKLHTNYTLSFNKAITYFSNASKVAEKENWHQQLEIIIQMAFISKRQNNFAKAIGYYEKAIQIASNHNELKSVSNLNGYLSEVYESNGDTRNALKCLLTVLQIEKNTEFKNTEPAAFISMAHYYELLRQWGPAETYFLDAMKIFKESNNHRWISFTNYLLAKLYIEKGNYKSAITYGETGLTLASKYKLNKEMADNHAALAEAYDSLHDYKNAYIHYKTLKKIDDSIFNIERAKEITNAQFIYEAKVNEERLAKVEAEKHLSESKLKKAQIISMAVVILFFMGLSLFIVFYKNFRMKRRINKELVNRDELKSLKLDEIIKQLNEEVAEHCNTKAKLEVINAELNNFMYKSSHDLKAPLASITGLTNLAKGNVSDTERKEYLAMILKSTSRLNDYIDELMQATLVTHGNVEISRINIYDFTTEIIDDLKNSENAKGVNILLEVTKDMVFETDKNLFKTILHNLIENAIKYKNNAIENPFVKIVAEKKFGKIKFFVLDNGLGITKEHQSKIFNMFYRANTTLPGSGLGLYLVKKSVIKLGGEIQFTSNQGEGTIFEFAIPDISKVVINNVTLT